jgi:hypothetical protein
MDPFRRHVGSAARKACVEDHARHTVGAIAAIRHLI